MEPTSNASLRSYLDFQGLGELKGRAARDDKSALRETAQQFEAMFLFQPGVDLRQIVDAVNQVGASPSSLIAILEALKTSGSLRAELVVI